MKLKELVEFLKGIAEKLKPYYESKKKKGKKK